MDEAPIPEAQAGMLRYLKILVTTLAATMILGLIVLIALIVMRFGTEPRTPLPDHLVLPAGVTATAVTRGTDWIGVVTEDGRILIYEPDGETLRQEIMVQPAP